MERHLKISLVLVFLTTLLCACTPTTSVEAYKNKTAQEIFTSAEKHLAKEKYDIAVQEFEALDTLYPFGPYAEQGQLDIIYAYYKSGDFASALAAADRYIRLYPRSPNVDYAYYMKGLVNYGRGDNWFQRLFPTDPSQRDLNYMIQSFHDFHELVQRFPDSRYAPDARLRMLYIRNLLAQHELDVAKFYFRRKAYVAAANRAAGLVEMYPQAPQVVPALAIMVESYQALGETQMANDTLQVLVANYPNSGEAHRLGHTATRI
jgi:outer membrane protein assembly factor BamD